MVDMPVYYHEEARVTNGVLVQSGVNWDASRNVLTVPFLPIAKPAAELRAPNPQPARGIVLADYQREVVRTAPAGEPGKEPPRAADTTPAAPPVVYMMRKADGTLQRMLERWAAESGWKVIWQAAPPIAITGDATVPGSDFLQAADLVIKQAQVAGYRLTATAHSDKVLRIGGSQ